MFNDFYCTILHSLYSLFIIATFFIVAKVIKLICFYQEHNADRCTNRVPWKIKFGERKMHRSLNFLHVKTILDRR